MIDHYFDADSWLGLSLYTVDSGRYIIRFPLATNLVGWLWDCRNKHRELG